MAVTGRRVSIGTGSKAGCEAPVAQLEIVCAGLGFLDAEECSEELIWNML